MLARTLARLLPILAVGVSSRALAQTTYDPPTAQRPAPNVLLLLDQTRTTQINGSTCRGVCHVENGCGGHGGEWDCSLWRNGGTRVQLARRVLTGGYGWNTTVIGPDGQSADGHVRQDGVMDLYKVRWGIAWYDGLGTRLALTPTTANDKAQQTVIDLNLPWNDDYVPPSVGSGYTDPGLHSYNNFPRTTQCCGNHLSASWPNTTAAACKGGCGAGNTACCSGTQASPSSDNQGQPWFASSDIATGPGGGQRMSRALQWVEQYWNGSATQFSPPATTSGYTRWFQAGLNPHDNLVTNDIANVLHWPASDARGCRRDFTVLMTDSHGNDAYAGVAPGPAAGNIYALGSMPTNKALQTFIVHFGVSAPEDSVADYGWDGVAGGGGLTTAFNGAPGGVPSMSAMVGAFTAIFSLILSGTYEGTAPTITRLGDHLAESSFTIRTCQSVGPQNCNLGRPGALTWTAINSNGSLASTPDWNAGDILQGRLYTDRVLYTPAPAGDTHAPTDTNCGDAAVSAECTSGAFFGSTGGAHAGHDARNYFGLVDTYLATNYPVTAPEVGNHSNFIMGDPQATFTNGVPRGYLSGTSTAVDGPYKLEDIANSRPVIVGAPPGIGENLSAWLAFRNSAISGNSGSTIAQRDQVMYIGGNDGFLHAFLTGKANATPTRGYAVSYSPIGTACHAWPSGSSGSETAGGSACDGGELWAYSPRLVQQNWPQIRGGHFYMVDGTPVVDDVLFTKSQASAGTACSFGSCSGTSWEYRTVLVECLGGGGPGCFALDVTNPHNPDLLWERSFACPGTTCVTNKGSSTSLPVLAKMKRVVSGKAIPYYVALMGGGANEGGASPKGTFIGIGLEDGQVFLSPTVATSPFAGGPACVDASGSGFIDTCYIASTDASIWKVRFAGGDPTNMSMVKFFNGRASDAANNASIYTYTRVQAAFASDNKLDIFFTTGNINAPSDPNERNFFFKVRDTDPKADPTASQAWDQIPTGQVSRWNLLRQSNACSTSPSALTAVTGAPGTYAMAAGEKVIFDPVLANGSFVFTSYLPDPNPCLIGNGYLYGINYDTCGNGLTCSGSGCSGGTAQKESLGAGFPSSVAVNYATGGLYDSVNNLGASQTNQITQAGLPVSTHFRVMKLWWREML